MKYLFVYWMDNCFLLSMVSVLKVGPLQLVFVIFVILAGIPGQLCQFKYFFLLNLYIQICNTKNIRNTKNSKKTKNTKKN